MASNLLSGCRSFCVEWWLMGDILVHMWASPLHRPHTRALKSAHRSHQRLQGGHRLEKHQEEHLPKKPKRWFHVKTHFKKHFNFILPFFEATAVNDSSWRRSSKAKLCAIVLKVKSPHCRLLGPKLWLLGKLASLIPSSNQIREFTHWSCPKVWTPVCLLKPGNNLNFEGEARNKVNWWFVFSRWFLCCNGAFACTKDLPNLLCLCHSSYYKSCFDILV